MDVVAIKSATSSPFEGIPVTDEGLDLIEESLLKLAQLEIPAKHRFINGLYIREAVMPAGSLIIGHYHTTQHWCVVLEGRFTLLLKDRSLVDVVAPCAFGGGTGRKIGFMLSDVRMQNIHSTEGWTEEDKSGRNTEFERHIYRKTAAFKAWEATQLA